MTVTDYLDVVSSWCFWSEPTWAELKRHYDGRVEFQWKIALMDPTGLPWYDPTLKEWLAPNAVAEAAKEFGITDDRVRHTLAGAALREGKKVSDWDVAAEIGAAAGNLEKKKLLETARSSAVEKRIRASTAEFHALQITQRPSFVIDTEIGDRVIFSGVVKLEPLAATLDSMLDDATAYAAHKAHFGGPPPK
ncbi:MAG: disulfide bond formation protein DsbA [Verrucomicrobia bacterium]|nr:MAG: disulfide bond formation protein DsbA [Verrucomicrobiota bacterium]